MLKSKKSKKRISFTLNADEYESLTRFAESEARKISNAARIITVRFLREFEKQ